MKAWISDANQNVRHALAEDLATVLADAYTLYLKTHNFHWNVTGPSFIALHGLFEQRVADMRLGQGTFRDLFYRAYQLGRGLLRLRHLHTGGLGEFRTLHDL